MSEGEAELPEIKWGRRRGVNNSKKEKNKVVFYESFTYDDVEYAKYDCVYLFKDDEPEPYIGKLVKMWETCNKKKKGKVLWFFQPNEISNFIGDKDLIKNEVFLASGEAPGLANINLLEAIAGKCNVVCISKDSRNRQPTDEEVRKADFVFRRTFDVGSLKIKDEIEEEIAGTDVKFLLNRMDSGEDDSGTVKVDLGTEEVSENPAQNDLTVPNSEQNVPEDSEAVKSNGHCIGSPENEGVVLNGLSTKPESPTREKIVSDDDMEKTNQTKESESDQKALSKSISKKRKVRAGKVVGQVDESEGKVNFDRDFDESEDKLPKKAKPTSENVDKEKNVVDEPIVGITEAIVKESLSPPPSTDIINEVKPAIKDSHIEEEGPSKKLKLGDEKTQLSKGKLVKTSTQDVSEDQKNEVQELAKTPKDKSKWFKDRPWEDELRVSHEQGKLVLLQNLDPFCTSDEVKDIIMQGFKEKNCKAKMIQSTPFSSRLSGQAFVIFETRDTAEMVVKRLKESCLLLSHGRPLVASPGTPYFPEKKPTFYGHLAIDKLKSKMPREQKDAVSTSHCSQPNSIEYEMATEWRLFQERSDLVWKKLYEQQEHDVRDLKKQLKDQPKAHPKAQPKAQPKAARPRR